MEEKRLAELVPQRLLDHYLNISRLLAGQLDFDSIIQAVAAEITHIVPYDHLDVCIKMVDGKFHIAYESGISTAWSRNPPALLSGSPIRTVLSGEVDHLLTDDARTDQRFHFEGSFSSPIIEHDLKGRLHVPLKAQGDIIGALSCSSLALACYTMRDVENAQSIADLLAPYFCDPRGGTGQAFRYRGNGSARSRGRLAFRRVEADRSAGDRAPSHRYGFA